MASGSLKADTYGRILTSSLELFATRGFGGTGIRDIASAVGLKTSALYHYMDSKEDLLFDMIQRGLGASLAASNEVLEGDEDPCRRLAALTASAVVIHAEYQRAYLVIDNEFHFIQGDTLERTLLLRDKIDQLWSETIAQGLATGEFQADDSHLVRLSLLSMLRGVAQWYSPKGSQEIPMLAEKISRLGLNLVCVAGDRVRASVPAADSRSMQRIIQVVHSTHGEVPR